MRAANEIAPNNGSPARPMNKPSRL
jgi:hypothetical protein